MQIVLECTSLVSGVCEEFTTEIENIDWLLLPLFIIISLQTILIIGEVFKFKSPWK